ncbi:MAG: exonuclease domain-containing protein [Wenzhouxiangellaceae bacterium]|nr:exonuclease domain-containing protein [Wenzhouxiangellaceae bacterium]
MKLLKRIRWRRLEKARAKASKKLPGSECRHALQSALPDPNTAVSEAPMLAIDLEMTGLDPARHQIVSIGWVPLTAGAIELAGANEVMMRPDPSHSVGSSATVHGIRDCDRGGGITLEQGLCELLEALRGRVSVFHHAPLDVGFLDRALRRSFGFGWLNPWIDTLDWHRRRQLQRVDEGAAAGTRLDAVRMHYGLAQRGAHNALDDALSCAEIALVMARKSRARLIDICALPSRSRR